jgi:hypothetical protein
LPRQSGCWVPVEHSGRRLGTQRGVLLRERERERERERASVGELGGYMDAEYVSSRASMAHDANDSTPRRALIRGCSH